MPESLFNKGSGLQPVALSKDAATRCFLVKFSKFKEEIIFKAQTKNCFCSLIVKRDSHFTVYFLGSSCGRFVNDRNFYKHFFLFLNFLCLLTTQKMKFSVPLKEPTFKDLKKNIKNNIFFKSKGKSLRLNKRRK